MQNKKIKQITRSRRVFSEIVRKQVVKDFEDGKCTVLQASRELSVSQQTIYYWLNKYSRYLKKGITTVVQNESEAYRSRELERRIKELEAALGRKSLEADYLNRLIAIAGTELEIDLKKNFEDKLSTDTGKKKASK